MEPDALPESPTAGDATVANHEPGGSRGMDRAELVRMALAAHEGPLLRYAASLLDGDLDRARDCVQDTFLKLCEHDVAKVAGHLAPWLFTVCRHRALDTQRKDRRMTPLEDALMESQTTSEPAPDETVARRDSASSAMAFLRELPPNQREVVRLKFQNQLSYLEIAQVTALSVTNVGFLLHTALKTLRHRMEQQERIRPGLSPTAAAAAAAAVQPTLP